MKEGNIIRDKSFDFAVRIINLYKFLINEKREFVVSKQICRSGTSIGANIEEAIGAHSKKDFSSKLSVAYKEARETDYWIKILYQTEFITQEQANSLLEDCQEILSIIGSIKKTLKNS